MAMGIKHKYQSATANDGAKEVSSTRWNEDHTITGEVTFPAVASPSSPATDNINVFGRKVGGRMMLGTEGPSGMETVVQPFLGRNHVAEWRGNSSATPSAVGIAAPTATGTATSGAVSIASRFTRMRRTEYLVTAAATTAVAGFRATALQWSVGASTDGDGGFHYICRWGPSTGVSTETNRAFVGMVGSTTAPTDVEPSTISNIVGMGWDAADTNIQIMHKNTGSVTKIDTGLPVPTSDKSVVYELAMQALPGTTQEVEATVTNLYTGAEFSTTITTNLPSASQLLAPRGWMSVGGTSSVIGIALMNMYIETDY